MGDYSDPDEKNDYDKSTDFAEEDTLGNTDVKINPDFYIHTALIRAQKCLLNTDVRAGFLSYCVFIEHIETLCTSAKKLEPDYYTNLETFKARLREGEQPKDALATDVKIANEKLRLMMTAVFNNKPLYDGLKTF